MDGFPRSLLVCPRSRWQGAGAPAVARALTPFLPCGGWGRHKCLSAVLAGAKAGDMLSDSGKSSLKEQLSNSGMQESKMTPGRLGALAESLGVGGGL